MGWLIAIGLAMAIGWGQWTPDNDCEKIDVVKIGSVPLFKICKDLKK